MKKILISVVLLSLLLFGCGKDNAGSNGNDNANNSSDTTLTSDQTDINDNANISAVTPSVTDSGTLTGIHHVQIVVANYGTIEVELNGDVAPISVGNFVKLASEGFYDGLTFHRIISGFMIQGGDPLGNGTGGSDNTIKGEFSSNGVANDLSHLRGAISMARAMNPDSASSQFFIVHEDSTYLDGEYAAFGYVTSGMEVVDAICEATPVVDNNGTVLPQDQPVIEKIVVID